MFLAIVGYLDCKLYCECKLKFREIYGNVKRLIYILHRPYFGIAMKLIIHDYFRTFCLRDIYESLNRSITIIRQKKDIKFCASFVF